MEWSDYLIRLGEAVGCAPRLVYLTSAQILAATPPEKTQGLREILSIHNAFSNSTLKRDVPEFMNLVQFEEGIRRTVAWMDATGTHADEEPPPWLSLLLQKAEGFLQELSS